MFLLRSRDSVFVDMSALALVMCMLACSSEPGLREADTPIPADSSMDKGSDAGESDRDGADAADSSLEGLDAGGSDGSGDAIDDASPGDDAGKDGGDDSGDASDGDEPDPKPAREQMWGVTVDDIQGISAITTSLKNFTKKPTTRIVFDEFMPASYYANAVKAVHEVSFVMGELLDSWYVAEYSVADYDARTVEYLDRLGGDVDIWEIGNEINGEWLCDKARSRCTEQQRRDVVTKMTGAYDRVKARGAKAALTLYYNKGCYSQASHEMFTWTRQQVPERMKSGLDYVFVSYYEDDCNGLQPNWEAVFTELGEIFPNSKLGFGECGTENSARKAEYIDRYYRMKIDAPRYVGGYFWWYFRQDMVPHTKPLFSVLNQAISDG